jgi:hypothetical protein
MANNVIASRFIAVVAMMALLSPAGAHAAVLPVTSRTLTVHSKAYAAPVTCTLTALADAYVSKPQATTNFGSATTLVVDPSSITTSRVFARFDLSTCSPSVPVGAILRSAQVRLFTATVALAAASYQLRRADSAWTEAAVTWNTQPGASGPVSASASVAQLAASGTIVTWNVISDVQDYASGAAANVGWRLSDAAEGVDTGTSLSFSSREAGGAVSPQLVLTYAP